MLNAVKDVLKGIKVLQRENPINLFDEGAFARYFIYFVWNTSY